MRQLVWQAQITLDDHVQLVGLLGLGMNHVAELRSEAAGTTVGEKVRKGRAKSVIFVFLSGGLTQHESFDPKPKAPQGIRGDFDPISTSTPGFQICEHLPMLAARSHKWSALRSLTSPYNGHSSGHMAFLSGRTPLPPTFNGNKPMPEDWPSIASIVGAVTAPRNNNLPPAAVLPERLIHRTRRVIPGQFAGRMGHRHDPWFIEASPFNNGSYGAYPGYEFHFTRGRERNKNLLFQAPNLSLPEGITQGRLGNRTQLLDVLESQRRDLDAFTATENFNRSRQGAINLLTDKSVQEAFDVTRAPEKVQQRYGKNAFGWSLLMARRLVETGVPFIEVGMGGWDLHNNVFNTLSTQRLPQLDQGIAALTADLSQRGMLDDVVLVWMGEFGRTPRINQNVGRDHWAASWSVMVGGGGIKGGQAVGKTDRDGVRVDGKAYLPGDIWATVSQALGIPSKTVHRSKRGRPMKLANGGSPIKELIG